MKKHEMNLAEALEAFLKNSGFQKKQKLSEIYLHLEEILGSNLAKSVESITLEEKKIMLHVKNPIWKQEFTLRQKEILLLIHEWLGFEAFENLEIK